MKRFTQKSEHPVTKKYSASSWNCWRSTPEYAGWIKSRNVRRRWFGFTGNMRIHSLRSPCFRRRRLSSLQCQCKADKALSEKVTLYLDSSDTKKRRLQQRDPRITPPFRVLGPGGGLYLDYIGGWHGTQVQQNRPAKC